MYIFKISNSLILSNPILLCEFANGSQPYGDAVDEQVGS